MQTNAHTPLWSPAFWQACLANFLLSVSMYMLWPVLPSFMMDAYGATPWQAGAVMSLFGVAMFLLGPTYAYMVDTYRRKGVCLLAILLVTLSTGGFRVAGGLLYAALLRLMQGMMYGVACMAAGSTLVIDISHSPRRTEANHAYSWFGRFGLSIGPLAGLLLYNLCSVRMVLAVSCLLGGVAFCCIAALRIPFRAPLCPPLFSRDRFWLANGWLMFLNLLLVALPTGILLGAVRSCAFYGMLMAGFCLALVASRFLFADADMRSEVVSGLILYGGGLLLLMTHPLEEVVCPSALLAGLGIGLTVPRFLLFYIRLSEHCERGTANTSDAFGWELGISLGFLIGCGLYGGGFSAGLYGVALLCLAAALLLYLFRTHSWYLRHRVR